MFAAVHTALDTFSGYLWGWPMLALLLGTGLWLTVLLRGLQFRMLLPALRAAFTSGSKGGEGEISNRSALMTALAATVGTGNIAGVATAMALGGPGAMFWMWMSGLLGMALKFSEVLLGVHYRRRNGDGTFTGGPMYYITRGTGYVWLGSAFAFFLTLAAIGGGGMVQVNSMADALKSGFNLSPTLVGAGVALAAGVIMFGGITRIAKVADKLVPFMIILYAIAGTFVVAASGVDIAGLFATVFHDAFNGTAAAGGFAGATVQQAMRYGLARGVFANESGLGSAPIVAAAAQTKHPTEQALISMTQTFIDTFCVCTFTAMVILATGAWQATGAPSGGASLTAMAFDGGLGYLNIIGMNVGSTLVTLCLFLFAFTTIIGWGYYGVQGAVYLWGKRAATPYLLVFLLCTWMGGAVLDWAASVKDGVNFIWLIVDITTGLMMIPNLFALLLLSPQVKRLADDYITHTRYGTPLKHKAFFEDYFVVMPKKKRR